MKILTTKPFILTGLLALLASCSSGGPTVQEFPATASAADEIQTLRGDIDTAKLRQVDALAPSNFSEASEYLEKAQQRQAKGKDSAATLKLVAKGKAFLLRAQEKSQLSRTNMEDVVIARQEALDAQALTLFPKDFAKVDDHLRDLTEEIEENNISNIAEKREKLQAEYRAIELDAIKHTSLNPARDVVESAKKEGGSKFAPRSLALAEKKIADTEAFIIGNRHAVDKIRERSLDAQMAAQHFLKITLAAKAGKNITGEDAALALEGARQQAASSQARLNLSGSELNLLKADKNLQDRFEKAQNLFSKDEAEVYKQDNKLLIRLRGLEFPRSQAVLKNSNFKLLGKVQNVINDFGSPTVVIEGYTDSDGNKVKNQKLSEARAEIVKEYFTTNAKLSPDSIKAVGYGDEKPLATNNTESGKAQNRRVDIVIIPTDTTL